MNKSRKLLSAIFLCALAGCGDSDRSPSIHRSAASSPELRVLTLNIWLNGSKVENGLEKVTSQIIRSQAQVVFLQEEFGAAAELAARLGMHVVSYGESTSILSQFPIEKSFRFTGAVGAIVNAGTKRFGFVSLHLPAYPYGPHMACHERKPAGDLLQEEMRVRGNLAENILQRMHFEFSGVHAVVIGGDFNSPSHLDWTESTKHLHCGRVIPFPVTKLMEKHSFSDAYREIFKDPLLHPGLTWSPVETHDLQDRIDFLFVKGMKVRNADIFLDSDLDRWPSDHAGVTAVLAY